MSDTPPYERPKQRTEKLEQKISGNDENVWRIIAENTNDVIWTLDLRSLKFNFVSPSIVKLTGYTPEEYLSLSFEDTLPSDFFVPLLDEVRRVVKGGNKGDVTKRFECQIYHKDGCLIWVEMDTKPFTGNTGKSDSIIGVVRDVSERKTREAHIEERNIFIETILAHLPIGLAVNTITDSKAIYMNEKFEEIYGWPKEYLVDIDSFFKYVYPDETYREKIRSRAMADINSGDPSRMNWEDITVTGENGEKKIVSAKNFPIVEQNLMISTVQDVTQRNQLIEQLHQAQKMKSLGTLTGGIAHDFNNILSIMIGNTELALDEVPEWNPAHSNLKNIKTAGLRAADILRQLLNFSRKTDFKKRTVKIIPTIRESLKLIRASIPATIEIRQDFPDDCDAILADPNQIHQIMINLCSNAKEAMEDNGILEVSIENVHLDDRYSLVDPDLKNGDYVKLSVSDTGCGIEPQDFKRIFEPYFTTKDIGKGTGMGLSVVHGIVKSHDGSIVVNSEPGKGTSIIIYFPSTDLEVEQDVSTEDALPVGNERILFVDDEKFIVELVQQMLERLGYKVNTRIDPMDALDLFLSNPRQFDLIIVDMTMPHITGDQLAIEILKHNPDVPIIICTGHSENLNEEKAKEIGIKAFLMKPLLRSDLANTVRKVLDLKQT